MIKIFCDSCQSHEPMRIDPMKKDPKDKSIWGDVCCNSCFLVLATITVEEEGIYEFVKIKEIKTKKSEG